MNASTYLHTFALTLSILLGVYHQVTTWVPLFPWNDVEKYSKKELILEAGVNGILMGVGCFCVWRANAGFFHWYPLIYYPILLLGECLDWWIPYFSETFARSRNIWDYEAHFSRTVKLLTHEPGRRTPDANHTVLHFMTLVTTVIVYLERLSTTP